MKTAVIYLGVLSLFVGAAAFFAANNLLIGLGVFLAFALVLCGLVYPMFAEFGKRARREHECYRFTNSFIITLSVCQSLEKSYDSAMESSDRELVALSDSLTNLNAREKLEYLDSFFEMPAYRMFLSLLDIYIEQGGDIVKISSELMQEFTRIEETRIAIIGSARKNAIQFAVLWLISLAIVVFLRIGLSNFYTYLSGSMTYMISLVIYFAFFLASLVVYAAFYTRLKFKLPKIGIRRKAK
ncbi:MAG: hypothetical protein K6F32_01600 [Bacilli bacterium]|nr:hypothetical protein [Bacilli bacterium]